MMTVASAEQIVTLRTAGGVQLYQFLASDQVTLRWTREKREVSLCDLTVAATAGFDLMPNLIPWLHWVDVWNDAGETLYWSGPIQRVVTSRTSISISARDVASLGTRTRSPLTKRWDAADPTQVAAELWEALIEQHGLNTRAIMRPDPRGERFDFAAVADEEMLSETVDKLVDLGLYWTVVAGVPILGPAPFTALASLGEHDFVGGELTLVRDGSRTFNDVLLRGADNLARAAVPMGGLRLQTIVHIDDMFGVSNVDRAVKQYVRSTAAIRDAVTFPDGVVLHPDAPVSIDQLIPSARFMVEGYGLLSLMELHTVEVSCSQGDSTVSVTLESVDDDEPELVKFEEGRR